MHFERAGAIALILGTLAYIGLMVVHPNHGGGEPIFLSFSLSAVVHAVALTMKPVLLFGFIALSRHLGFDRPLVVLALSFYALASVFTMMAGTMSGLVFPYLVEAAHAPGGSPADIQPFAQYTMWLNRSFARVNYNLVAIAILLWSIAWPGKSMLTLLVRGLGVVCGLGVLGWQLSGTMTIEAQQGALILTAAEGLWALAAAMLLFGAKRTA